MIQTKNQTPAKWFQKQKPMMQVCYALMPLVAASVFFFGWRALALCVTVLFFGVATEAVFAFKQGMPVTAAVLVTCLIFSLSLPSTVPFWIAIIGIVVAVALGKMVFGGFGRNIFNPAMVGRCFIYVTFPTYMTSTWAEPSQMPAGGFEAWTSPPDAITRATPLITFKDGISTPLADLFWGGTSGSLGETSAFFIVLGLTYLIYKKVAPWRIALSCLLGGVLVSGVLNLADIPVVASPLFSILSGSFLFGTAFVATEPISGAKTKTGQWIYGLMIGGLTIILRGFSNFSEGMMFSVLIMNAFVPIMDQTVRQIQTGKKASQ